MEKLTSIVKEMQISDLPQGKLLDWFRDRVDNTFVIFDTETTGLERYPEGKEGINQLTQIAAIAAKLDNETFEFIELERFNIKIKLNDDVLNQMKSEPKPPEDVNSKEYQDWKFKTISGILVYNHYDLANSDKFENERNALESFDNFLKKFSQVTLIAHNAPFDLKWIQYHTLFIDSTDEIIDTYDFFKNFFFPILHDLSNKEPEYKEKYDRFPNKDSKTKSWSLKNLVAGFHNEVNQLKNKLERAHDAIVDCEMTMKVLEDGLKLIKPYL